MAGCSGDDGNGAAAPGCHGRHGCHGCDGRYGRHGCHGSGAKIEPRESCGVCHDDGSVYASPTCTPWHRGRRSATPVFAVSGADLVMTFNVKLDGVNATTFTRHAS